MLAGGVFLVSAAGEARRVVRYEAGDTVAALRAAAGLRDAPR
eukprot:gene15544-5599_t